MSFYVKLEKMPDSPDERKKLIEKQFEYEKHLDSLELTYIQRKVAEFLLCRKGYSPQDIETNKEFSIGLQDFDFTATADLIVKPDDKRFIFVKCAVNSLDSWERVSAAFCRVIDSYQIPYAFITDGENAKLLNTADGSVTDGNIDIIPSRNEAESMLSKTSFQSYPEDRKEKEKRIIYAFEGIKCSPSPEI